MEQKQTPIVTFSAEELQSQGYIPENHPAYERNVSAKVAPSAPTEGLETVTVPGLDIHDVAVAQQATKALGEASTALTLGRRYTIDGTTGAVLTADEAKRGDRGHARLRRA